MLLLQTQHHQALRLALVKKPIIEALGVDVNGQPIENITETLDKSGFVSSVISTSEVTHATPAAFVAHTSSRYSNR